MDHLVLSSGYRTYILTVDHLVLSSVCRTHILTPLKVTLGLGIHIVGGARDLD